MATSSASKVRTIGFGVFGLVAAAAGLTLVLSDVIGGSVSDAHPDGILGLAGGTAPALRHEIVAELAPERGPNIAITHADQARRLLKAAPLDTAALTYLGLAADANHDTARSHTLMTLALRSDGRSPRARFWLVNEELKHGNYERVIDDLDRLVKIGPQGRSGLVVAMTALIRDPASHAPLARKLAKNPPWRQLFLTTLNQQKVSANVIFKLTSQSSTEQTALVEQAALLQALLKAHDYEKAYLAWINFLPETALQHVGPIYDPQFQHLPGPLPFNWYLPDGTEGSAEFRQPRGLTVSYLGQAPTSLAAQTLMLAAGRYRLSVTASGSDSYNQLAWTVGCIGVSEPLQTLTLTALGDGPKRYETTFDVPASSCETQQLVLAGSPGEFPHAANAAIDAVLVEPVK